MLRRNFLKLSSLSNLAYWITPFTKLSANTQIYKGPIYDAHAHIGKAKALKKVMKEYKKNGIKKAMFFIDIKDAEKTKKILGNNYYLFTDAFTQKKRGDTRYQLKDKPFKKLKKLIDQKLFMVLENSIPFYQCTHQNHLLIPRSIVMVLKNILIT